MLQSLLSITFLTIASAYDLKTREVPNKIWVIFIPLSIITTTARLLTDPNQFTLTLISIAITALISIVIFYLGLYGGADAKALITLAIAHPTPSNQGLVLPILPLTTFNNSLILMVLTIPAALVRNLYWTKKSHRPLFHGLEKEPAWRKVAALLLCIKKSKSEIKPYNIPAERIETIGGEMKRTLKIFQRVKEEDTSIDDTIPEDVFITYSLPMLPFLTIGYIVAITIGDLIFHTIRIFL